MDIEEALGTKCHLALTVAVRHRWRDSPDTLERVFSGTRALIAAAEVTDTVAIHPGYGFLSENAAFAEQLQDAGIAFIGPRPESIQAMGLKAESKRLMESAGVPLVPGYHGADQDPALLRREADRIGYPVLIKASAGGGGKGMRAVQQASEFEAALASCKREALTSFADDHVLVDFPAPADPRRRHDKHLSHEDLSQLIIERELGGLIRGLRRAPGLVAERDALAAPRAASSDSSEDRPPCPAAQRAKPTISQKRRRTISCASFP